jgi:hypothetical protein
MEVLSLQKGLEDYRRALVTTKDAVHRYDQPGTYDLEYPRDFLNLEGVRGIMWDDLTDTIVEPTLQEIVEKGLMSYRSLILMGLAGGGKTFLQHALLRRACRATQRGDERRDNYVYLKQIDPLGQLTLSDTMKSAAGLALADFEMKSQLNLRLNTEHAKALFDVTEPLQIPCRYSVGMFAKGRPRIFSVNTGDDETGAMDPCDWFKKQGLDFVELLFNKDLKGIRELKSEHKKGVLRRIMLVYLDRRIIKDDVVFELRKAAEKKAKAEVKFLKSHFSEIYG